MAMFGASADPCAALFGSMKQDCENARNGVQKAITGTGSVWGFLTNSQNVQGGLRHVFVRVAEVTIGGLLIIVGINALVKAQTGTDVLKNARKVIP